MSPVAIDEENGARYGEQMQNPATGMEDLVVIIERTDTGYSAYAPDLPGCVTVGDTIGETQTMMEEAVSLYLEESHRSRVGATMMYQSQAVQPRLRFEVV